jgi:anti-sigma B factor antagonist
MDERTPFQVDTSRVGEALVVAPHGDVDLATAPEVQSALESHASGGALVLDLRGVEFLDTSGLRIVVEASHRAAAGGYRFAVVRGPARIQRIFDIAGLASDELLVDDPAEVTGNGETAS